MKKTFPLLIFTLLAGYCISGCSIFGKRKSGCPVGRNVGAERILSGDPKAIKAAAKKSKVLK